MKKLNLQFTLLMLLFSSISAMNKELFTELRTLPTELQQYILLLKEDINFLSLQPITLTRPNRNNYNVTCVAIDHDTVITANCNAIRIWDIHTGKFLRVLIDQDPNDVLLNIKSIAIVDNKIIVPLLSNIIRIYDLQTGELLNRFTRPSRPGCGCSSLAVHNNHAIIGAYDGTTEIWDINTSECLYMFTRNSHGDIWSVTTDDDIIVAGSHDKTTSVWDHNGNLLHTLTEEEEKKHVYAVAIHNNTIINGLWDGTIHIWDKHTGEFLCTFGEHSKHTQRITSMAVQDNLLLTGSWDKTAKIWYLQTNELLRTLTGPNGHTDNIDSVAMNHEVAITGSHDKTAKIWPLFPNLKGASEDNPLLWIIHNTDMLQMDFIQRAYEKTIANENFIIDLPKKLGVIENDESPEQMDCRIYFTLPAAVREYLRTRLNIRK